MRLKGGFDDSAHVHESKFFFSPLHVVARTQATSFNCIVNEPGPIGKELIARVHVKVACEGFQFDDFTAIFKCRRQPLD